MVRRVLPPARPTETGAQNKKATEKRRQVHGAQWRQYIRLDSPNATTSESLEQHLGRGRSFLAFLWAYLVFWALTGFTWILSVFTAFLTLHRVLCFFGLIFYLIRNILEFYLMLPDFPGPYRVRLGFTRFY